LTLAGLLVIGALSGLVQGGTFASYNNSARSTANAFVSGTLLLTAGIATGQLAVSNLVPGDSFTAGVNVQNGGTLGIIYALTTSVSGSAALANSLQLTIRTKTANPCASQDGTVLYGPGNLSAAAFGSVAKGLQIGDRQLAAGAGETLCFTAQLPSNASTTLQGNTSIATFTFYGQQN
jgi:predicted ribosomally synthesized peptide with SipW-like signal peptide